MSKWIEYSVVFKFCKFAVSTLYLGFSGLENEVIWTTYVIV